MIYVLYVIFWLALIISACCFFTELIFLTKLPESAEGVQSPFYLSGTLEVLLVLIAVVIAIGAFVLSVVAFHKLPESESKDFE